MPWNSISLGANLFYRLSTEGTQDTTIGGGVFYSLALTHRLGSGNSHNHHDHGPHGEWDLILELNGEWREKVNIGGIPPSDNNRSSGYSRVTGVTKPSGLSVNTEQST